MQFVGMRKCSGVGNHLTAPIAWNNVEIGIQFGIELHVIAIAAPFNKENIFAIPQ